MDAVRVLALCALAGAARGAPLPLGASASSSREGHTAAAAFDATAATYWQSSTPAPGSWLVYVFPMNVSVLQYALTVPDDSRYAASDGPVAFELQASTGDSSWTPIDRRFDEALWRPAETRVFTAKYPASPEGDATPYRAFRLLIAKVPGRTADLSFASVADMRFLTRESLPPLCEQLEAVAVNITALGMPPGVNDTATGVSASGTAQEAQLYIYVNVTNTGVNPVSLRDVHLPLRFSRGVQSWDGLWSAPPAETFNLSCWGLYITRPDAKPNAKQVDLRLQAPHPAPGHAALGTGRGLQGGHAAVSRLHADGPAPGAGRNAGAQLRGPASKLRSSGCGNAEHGAHPVRQRP